jgi:hypothetical protein
VQLNSPDGKARRYEGSFSLLVGANSLSIQSDFAEPGISWTSSSTETAPIDLSCHVVVAQLSKSKYPVYFQNK